MRIWSRGRIAKLEGKIIFTESEGIGGREGISWIILVRPPSVVVGR